MVQNADWVHKIYHTFDKVFYKVYNTIEYSKCDDLQFFDGYKDLKYSTQDFTKNALFQKRIPKALWETFKGQNLINYGIDLMLDQEEKTIYIIDVNVETFMWLRYATQELFRENLWKRYVKMIGEFKAGFG